MLDEVALKNILMPILDGLEAVHKIGFLHRDIKPSNVFIRESGVPVLLDFGSARMAAGGISKSMTAIVSPGYAPLEQYSNDGNQGAWSDVYALSCVMYRAVTGANPPNAIKRIKADDAPAALRAAHARYSERFLKAIEWGMKLDERIRPQSVAEWRDLFLDRAPVTAFSRGPSVDTTRPNATAPAMTAADGRAAVPAPRASRAAAPRAAVSKREAGGKTKWLIVAAIVVIVLAALALAATMFNAR